MSVLQGQVRAPISERPIENVVVSAGAMQVFTVPVKGSRLGVSVRITDPGTARHIRLDVQGVNPSEGTGANAVGPQETIIEFNSGIVGDATYTPNAPRVTFRLYNEGATSITVEAVYVTHFAAGAAQEPNRQMWDGASWHPFRGSGHGMATYHPPEWDSELESTTITAGSFEALTITPRAGRVGVAIRLEAVGTVRVDVQPYNPSIGNAYAVGAQRTILYLRQEAQGTTTYTPTSPRFVIRVYNDGSSDVTIRALYITHFSGSADSGDLMPQATKGAIVEVRYHKDNASLIGQIGSSFEIRDTSPKTFRFRPSRVPTYDQSFAIHSTLDKALIIGVQPMFLGTAGTEVFGAPVFSGGEAISVEPGGRLIFVPSLTGVAAATNGRVVSGTSMIVECGLLREPVYGIVITATAGTAPTTGEISIHHVYRQ